MFRNKPRLNIKTFVNTNDWTSTQFPSKTTIRNLTSRKDIAVNHSRTYFEHFASRNKLSKTDWYQISPTKLDDGIRNLISKDFKGSMYLALTTLFPETEWHAWKFQHFGMPKGYWKEHSNQRKFFEYLGQELGVQNLDDWYQKLSQDVVTRYGGGAIRKLKTNSVFTSLMAAYPDHNWLPWKFNWTTRGFWKSKENQRAFFDWLGQHIGIRQLDDWYGVYNRELLEAHGGRAILFHNDSVVTALTSCYPEHNWLPWKFNVPQGFWKSIDNQRNFFDWLGKELGVQHLDDWYTKATFNNFQKYGGTRLLLVMYNGSPAEALRVIYPQHHWVPWKFANVSRGYWSSKENISLFLTDLEQKLSIQTLDDWYRVDWQQLKQFGAASLLIKYKGLHNLLKHLYPEHSWDPKKFQSSRKGQRWLVVTLNKMFPGEDIIEDYQHPKASFPSTNRPMQLDVYIPSRSLAFEYQGKQHYEEVSVFSPLRTYQQRDEEKRVLCIANNIKLIEVPYWWNRTQESLEQIINTS